MAAFRLSSQLARRPISSPAGTVLGLASTKTAAAWAGPAPSRTAGKASITDVSMSAAEAAGTVGLGIGSPSLPSRPEADIGAEATRWEDFRTLDLIFPGRKRIRWISRCREALCHPTGRQSAASATVVQVRVGGSTTW
jgi:hypothetical protein